MEQGGEGWLVVGDLHSRGRLCHMSFAILCQFGGASLKPTPIWDDLGWSGMNREGVGAEKIAKIAKIG